MVAPYEPSRPSSRPTRATNLGIPLRHDRRSVRRGSRRRRSNRSGRSSLISRSPSRFAISPRGRRKPGDLNRAGRRCGRQLEHTANEPFMSHAPTPRSSSPRSWPNSRRRAPYRGDPAPRVVWRGGPSFAQPHCHDCAPRRDRGYVRARPPRDEQSPPRRGSPNRSPRARARRPIGSRRHTVFAQNVVEGGLAVTLTFAQATNDE